MNAIDQEQIHFSSTSLLLLNIILGIIMFGISLDLKLSDFKPVFQRPWPVLIGLISQVLILPAFSFVLITLLKPQPSIALGILLIAACPGGNMSNFFTYLAKGNTPLSITMSAVSTLIAGFMTPLNITFWAHQNPDTANLFHSIDIDPLSMVVSVILLLVAPLLAGLFISHRFPEFAKKGVKVTKYFGLSFLVIFIVMAFASNFHFFLEYFAIISIGVFLLNTGGLFLGYAFSRLFRLNEADCRAVSIEVGIQNAGLGLVLIFTFFNGLGGMAMVMALYGVWDLVTGLGLALWWSRRPVAVVQK